MGKEYRTYKVTGTVKFSVDDIFSDSPTGAKEMFKDNIDGNMDFAGSQGTYELLDEVEVEDIGPCSEEELRDIGYI